MAKKIAKSTLNASTVDILNVIRNYASTNYQQSIPVIETERDIPKVGEIIVGTPALANEFIESLVNRIALTLVQSATFNNPYAFLKKGMLEFGESVEDIFVEIAKVVEYPGESPRYEFGVFKPDVRASFAARNWQVMYPITIEDDELKTAFLSMDGVQDLISRIVNQMYTARSYDEFLIIKYLIIKGATQGKLAPQYVDDDNKELTIAVRSMSSKWSFMSNKYNIAHVKNTCPMDRQIIFMQADDIARIDVEDLAAAYNLSKAEMLARIIPIDDWTSFDNERFEQIVESTDRFEKVTDAELEAMKSVKAMMFDEEWFQIYTNLERFTEKYVASNMRWNFFLHVWMTIATSPFANACLFITESPIVPDSLTFKIADMSVADGDGYKYAVINLEPDVDNWTITGFQDYKFIQTREATDKVVGVEPYGSYMFEKSEDEDGNVISVVPYVICNDTTYKGDTEITQNIHIGDEIKFEKTDEAVPYSITTLKVEKEKKSKKSDD